MKVVFEPSPSTPLVAFSITAQGGSACDPVGLEGLSRHAIELARRGAGSLSRRELDEELDFLGASLNAGTTRDSLSLIGLCLAKHLDRVVELALDVLCRPHFAAEEHEKLIRESKADLDEARDDDGTLASRFFTRHVFPNHAYGRTVWGTDETLTAIEDRREDAEKRLRGAFCGQNIILGLAGGIDQRTADAITLRISDALPGGSAATLPEAEKSPPGGRRLLLVDKPGRKQSQVVFGHSAPGYGDDMFAPLLAAETSFGGMFSSPLVQEIRVKRGWSYGVGTSIARGRAPLWLRVDFAPTKETTRDALALATDLFARFANEGPPEDELRHAQQYLVGSIPFTRATARQRMRQAVVLELYGLPQDYPDTVIKRVANTSPGEAKEAVGTWFRPKDLATLVLCTADDQKEALGDGSFGSLTVEAWDSY